jgi:hypothetical protein
MKSIAGNAVAGVLALAVVVMETLPAHGDPQKAPNQGCLGQTYNVTIERHQHISTKINELSVYSPTGSPELYNYDLSMRGTYVQELRDGKLQWVSRSILWSGQYWAEILGCYRLARSAGGHLELPATDGDLKTMSAADLSKLVWIIKPETKLGASCFLFAMGGSDPVQLPSPWPRATGDQLRYAHGAGQTFGYYSTVDRDGTRYSERVSATGSEQLSISAEPSEIDPNQPGTVTKQDKWVPADPDQPGSQLTITATCDGDALKGRQIGVRIDVEPRSGYHNHLGNSSNGTNYPRPRGKLAAGNKEPDCGASDTDISGPGARPGDSDNTPCIEVQTDENGKAKVKFKSPLTGSVDHPKKKGSGNYMSGIAGTYRITATDLQTTTVPASTEIQAKVKDANGQYLKLLKQSERLTGSGETTAHPRNLYGTGKDEKDTKGEEKDDVKVDPKDETLDAFRKFANAFYLYQKKHNEVLASHYCNQQPWAIVPLSLNDIALPDGGIFDLMEKQPAWGPSHFTHSKGGGGDFNRFTDKIFKPKKKKSDPDIPNTGIECGGTIANLQIWYTQVMVELGKDYGKWDCKDMGARSDETFIIGPGNCKDGDIPTGYSDFNIPPASYYLPPTFVGPPVPFYFPPLLHLHVED